MPWVFQPLLLCILNVLIDQSVHVRVDHKHWHEYTCGKLTFWIDDKDVADTLFDQPDAVASVRLKASYDRQEWDLVVQRMAELAEKETSFAAQPRSDTMCATDQPVSQVIAEFENHLINQLVDQLVNQLVGGLCRQIALEFINFNSTSRESIDRSFSLSSADSLTDEVFPDEEKEISAKDDDKDGLARQGNIEKEKSNEEHDEENDEENNDENNDENNTAEHDATSDTSENSSSTSNDEGELAEETVFDILKEHALEQRNEAVEENPENKEPEPVRKESVEQVKKEPAEQLEKEPAEQDEKNPETKKENQKQQEELNLAKSTQKNPEEKKQDKKKQDERKQDEKKQDKKKQDKRKQDKKKEQPKKETNGNNSKKNKLEKKQTGKDVPKKQEMKHAMLTGRSLMCF